MPKTNAITKCAKSMLRGICFVYLDCLNMPVALVLCDPYYQRTICIYFDSADTLPGEDPGEDRERLLSFNFQLQYTVDMSQLLDVKSGI